MRREFTDEEREQVARGIDRMRDEFDLRPIVIGIADSANHPRFYAGVSGGADLAIAYGRADTIAEAVEIAIARWVAWRRARVLTKSPSDWLS